MSGPAKGISRTLGVLLALGIGAATGAAGGQARGDDTLRWKFNPGETTNYVLSRTVDGTFDFNGQEINFTFKLLMDLTWNVKEVAADGTTTLGQRVDRIHFQAESPIGGELKWDSLGEEPESNPMWAMMGAPLKAILDGEITLKVSPTGKVSDITIPDELAKKLDEGSQRGRRMMGGGISTSLVKEMIERAFVHLPEKALGPDVKWEQQFSSAFGNAGTQFTDVAYSYQGLEDKGGKKVAKIVASTELSFEPNEDSSEIEVDITDQEGKSEILFDVAGGRTLDSATTQKMTIEIVAGEREMSQKIEEKIELRQGKSDPPAKEDKPAADKPADK